MRGWAWVLLPLLATPAAAQFPAPAATTVEVTNAGFAGTQENSTFELDVTYSYALPPASMAATVVELRLEWDAAAADATLAPTTLFFDVSPLDVQGRTQTQTTYLFIRWNASRASDGPFDFVIAAAAAENGNLAPSEASLRLPVPAPPRAPATEPLADTSPPEPPQGDAIAAWPVVLGVLAFGGVAWVVAGRRARNP